MTLVCNFVDVMLGKFVVMAMQQEFDLGEKRSSLGVRLRRAIVLVFATLHNVKVK